MKTLTPTQFPTLSTSLFYAEPLTAIDWLCAAFGFEVRIKVLHDGALAHSELVFGDALIMVSTAGRFPWAQSPKKLGGGSQAICVYVDDVEAHFLRAKRAGAEIVSEPKDSDHGEGFWVDRSYACFDVEGHHWWFVQRLRDR